MAVLALTLALTACTSSTPYAAPTAPPASIGPVVSSVAAPGCGTASAPGPQLPAGLARLSSVPADPFGVAVSADGRWSFVSLAPNASGGAVGVFADTGSATPRLVRQIPVSGLPQGMTLTPGDR